MKINEKIRDLRAGKCISQEYMANQLGIDTSSYHRIERGVTPLSICRLERIARVLEVDVVSIISTKNEEDTKENADNKNYIQHLEEEITFLRNTLHEKLSFLSNNPHQSSPGGTYQSRRR
ncbi:MAG: helix-turn-helix transcriptional regulator [Bacteroidia bacterium]